MTDSPEYWAGPVPPEPTKEAWSNQADTPLPPEHLVGPAWFNRILVMPMAPPKTTAGGIILTESYIHDQTYLSYVGRIVSIGPKAFKSKRFQALGFEDSDLPVRGEWWLYDIYQMRRYACTLRGSASSIIEADDGMASTVRLLILNEEALLQRIPEGANPWDFRLER